ncbi:MAG: hypothetical protein Q7K42_01410, partial [Candidatus Diapherotrites archaeon]|nr:hypothetical protein [Candidatus Diapherotrites archaeon]
GQKIQGVVNVVVSFVKDFVDAVGDLFSGKKDPCKKNRTGALDDYIINLVSDAKSIAIPQLQTKIKGSWGDGTISTDPEVKTQTTGIVLENLSLTDADNGYAILEVSAYEHIHGDQYHLNPSVSCRQPFGSFNLGASCGEQVENKTQKFHVKINTVPEENFFPIANFDDYSCENETTTGITGQKATPKIAFDWSWKNIDTKFCNKDNNSGVYCDATQFTIMMLKRVNEIQKFLEQNKNNIVCPTDPTSQVEQQQNSKTEKNLLELGKYGATQIETVFDGQANTLKVKTTFENDLATQAVFKETVSVNTIELTADGANVTLKPLQECKKDVSIAGKGKTEIECEFKNLAKNNYVIDLKAENQSSDYSEWNPQIPIVVISDPVTTTGQCWSQLSTTKLSGVSTLTSFVDDSVKAGKTIQWTSEITKPADIENMLFFNALLMKDGFSDDFRKDFIDYYTKINFLDTPTYFSKSDSKNQLQDFLLDKNNFDFRQEHYNSSQLAQAGEYSVQTFIIFSDTWDLYNAQGKPKAGILIMFNHLKDPYPNWSLYTMPLDGQVGLQGSVLERQGYGTAYNIKQGNEIKINNDSSPLKTFQSSSGNPQQTIDVYTKDDLATLNTLPQTRGNLLKISTKSNTKKELTFSPGYATPVMLKFSHGIADKKFSAFYALSENDQGVATGSSSTFWEGANNCLDYSGKTVKQAFDFKSDRKSKPEDNVPGKDFAYALDWENSSKQGNVYLRTIFYTPAGTSTALKTIAPLGSMKFITPETEADNVSLGGIPAMEYNSESTGAKHNIESIQDVLELVQKGKVCVNDTGLEARYFWNPKAIYTQQGTDKNSSIHDKALKAEEQKLCILN